MTPRSQAGRAIAAEVAGEPSLFTKIIRGDIASHKVAEAPNW